jgi:hypothetical protein
VKLDLLARAAMKPTAHGAERAWRAQTKEGVPNVGGSSIIILNSDPEVGRILEV